MKDRHYDDPDLRDGDGLLLLTLVLVVIGGLVVVLLSALISSL